MKTLFENRMKKIAIILTIVTLFNFAVPICSNADVGVLVKPVKELVLTLFDGMYGLLQYTTMGTSIVDWSKYLKAGAINSTGALADVLTEMIFDWSYTNSLNEKYGFNDRRFQIQYTPDKIFTNKINLLDINFFNPSKQIQGYSMYNVEQMESVVDRLKSLNYDISSEGFYTYYSDVVWLKTYINMINLNEVLGETSANELINDIDLQLENMGKIYSGSDDKLEEFMKKTLLPDDVVYVDMEGETRKVQRPYTKGQIEEMWDSIKKAYEEYENNSTATVLRKTISKWYNILRTMAIIGMMMVLVYLGIRIIIYSTGKDKAKYKQMLVDWLVAMCLLFFMQYIMTFSIFFTEKITDILNSYFVDYSNENYINNVRLIAEISTNSITAWANVVVYIILFCITAYFTFVYLKRVLYLAFLTLISPMVAFTYPIDKVKDGQAQAFNSWLKEYIFNLLIQPMHLILYTVLIGAAKDLSNNMVYVIIALGFMTQAEKIVRSFFGFEKAKTPGLIPGSAGGALMMEGFKALTGWGPGGHKSGGKGEKGGDKSKDSSKIRTKSTNPYEGVSDNNEVVNVDFGNEGDNDAISENSVDGLPYSFAFEGEDKSKSNNSERAKLGSERAKAIRNQMESTEENSGTNANKEKSSTNEDKSGSKETAKSTQRPEAAQNNKVPSEPERYKGNKSRRSSAMAAARAYGRSLKRRISAKKVVGTLAKGAGMIGGMAIGLGIGASQGDLRSAFQGSIIGARGGGRLLGGTSDALFDAYNEDKDGVIETYKRKRYGDEQYEIEQRNKQYKEWKQKNEETLIRNIGEEKYKQISKNGNLQEYFDYGINNVEDVIAGEKFREQNSSLTANDAVKCVKIANSIGDYWSMTEKNREDARKTLEKNFKRNNPDLSDTALKLAVDKQIEYIDSIHSAKRKVL